MYAAFIFTALITVSQAFANQRVSSGREFGVDSRGLVFQVADDQSLRSTVEVAVASIDRISRSSWKAEQKLTAIQMELQKVENFRKALWSKSPATEHKLDLMIRPYESFPEAFEFRKQNCKSYYSTLKIDWEPTARGEPTLKGVKRAWNNLHAICEG